MFFFLSNKLDIFYEFISIMPRFFYVLFFNKIVKIINFFLHVPYYHQVHQVQYTIRHDFSNQIKFFEKAHLEL